MHSPQRPSGDGLGSLPPPLRALAERGSERRYRKGAIFIQEGEPGGPLYFIVSGRARAFSSRLDGQEFTFDTCGPGSFIGELSLDGGPRSASVMAEEDVLCRIVTRQTLDERLAEDRELPMALITHLIQRVRQLSERATHLALDDAQSRLEQLLLAESEPLPGGTRRMKRRLTQEQIAQRIGCSRPMVTRLLGDMERNGGLQRGDAEPWLILRALRLPR